MGAAVILLIALPFVRLVLEPPGDPVSGVVLALQPAVAVALVAYLFGLSLKPDIWGIRAYLAARRGRLRLVYQPKTAIGGNGNLVSFEALVRWDSRKPHPPDLWIPHIERGRFMRWFNLWVVDAALEQVAAWRREGRDLQVCVNLSPQFLADPSLPDRLLALTQKWELSPGALPLEITERALAEGGSAAETVERLAVMGFELFLDDFGIGYSSLRRLVTLPLVGVKVDRSFVMEMETSERSAAAVQSAVELGRSLGLTVCAEGVETVETWHRLRLLGVDVAQGYLIARPLSPPDAIEWFERTGGSYLPDRRDGEDRRRTPMSVEEVIARIGAERRRAERRHSARDALLERHRGMKLLETDDLPELSMAP